MELSKQTQDQIRQEAEACTIIESSTAYKAGATAWAIWKQKAEGYEKALKEIWLKEAGLGQRIAAKALEQWK